MIIDLASSSTPAKLSMFIHILMDLHDRKVISTKTLASELGIDFDEEIKRIREMELYKDLSATARYEFEAKIADLIKRKDNAVCNADYQLASEIRKEIESLMICSFKNCSSTSTHIGFGLSKDNAVCTEHYYNPYYKGEEH